MTSEKVRDQHKIWYQKNKSKVKELQQVWYQKNKNSVMARAKKWNEDHPEKRREYTRKWTSNNIEHKQNYHLKRKYNITLEEQKIMLAAQHHRCAICKTDTPKGRYNKWHVDHCHKSKQVRGLLCWRCNSLVGAIETNSHIMKSALSYIKKAKSV